MDVAFAPKPMNCLLYLRVSTEEQVSNFSLDTQFDLCKSRAEQLGYTVTGVFREEGASAKTANRPELIKLLEYCRLHKNEIHSVLVYRIDRMARETSDYLAIRKRLFEYGIKLESATEPTGNSPTEKFIETVMAANAELDNSIKAERVKNGLYKRFKAGYPLGLPPLGYKIMLTDNNRKTFVPNPPVFDLVKKTWEIMGTGTKTLSEIVKIMNDMGLKTHAGKPRPISKQYASSLFKTATYAGILVSPKYPGEEVKGAFELMISGELFYRVQDIISNRRTSPLGKRMVSNPSFPLRGIVTCFNCRRPLVSGNCQGNTKVYALYWCQKCRGVKTISTEKLDYQLKERLAKLQPNPKVVDLFTLILRATYNKRVERLETSRKTAEAKILELKGMYNLLVETFLKGKLSEDIFNEQKIKIENQIMAAKIVANDSTCDKYDLEGTINFIKALFYDLPKAYEVSDYGQKRVLISSIYPSGLLYKQGELLNSPISSLWSAIQEFSRPHVFLSALGETRTPTPLRA